MALPVEHRRDDLNTALTALIIALSAAGIPLPIFIDTCYGNCDASCDGWFAMQSCDDQCDTQCNGGCDCDSQSCNTSCENDDRLGGVWKDATSSIYFVQIDCLHIYDA